MFQEQWSRLTKRWMCWVGRTKLANPGRFFILFLPVCFLLVCVVLPLLNYLAYEVQPKVDLLRESIGKQVVVATGTSLLFDRYEGRLESVRYRANDVVGFFDLNIEIRGKCGGSLGLRPWELDRITIVESETGGKAEGVCLPKSPSGTDLKTNSANN
jgi:hypothetical protein